jgi:hypothetical protein
VWQSGVWGFDEIWGRGGPGCRVATARSFTDKLLANPHSALRRDSLWQKLWAKLDRTHYEMGEKWWGSEGTANPNLTAQQPLLDGVEGKLVDSTAKDNRAATHTSMPGMAVSILPSGLADGTVVDPPVASTRVLGGGSWPPALVSKGAVEHVTNLVATTDTVAFTPRHLFGRSASHGSKEILPSVKLVNDAAAVKRCLLSGLEPPCLDATRGRVTGADTPQQRIKKKCRQKALLATQSSRTQWTMYQGELNSQPLWPHSRPIGAKCAHLVWLSIIQPPSSSKNGPPMVAPLALECLGQRQKCRRQWIGDLITRPCPTKPLLISRRRSRRR